MHGPVIAAFSKNAFSKNAFSKNAQYRVLVNGETILVTASATEAVRLASRRFADKGGTVEVLVYGPKWEDRVLLLTDRCMTNGCG